MEAKENLDWAKYFHEFLRSRPDEEMKPELVQEILNQITPDDIGFVLHNFVSKDVVRRYLKTSEIIAESIQNQPLLRGPSLKEACNQSFQLVNHVHKLWEKARALHYSGDYFLAVFLSILSIEEIGKLTPLRYELTLFSGTPNRKMNQKKKKNPMYNHRMKHYFAAAQGALINSRLDRVLGAEAIKKFIEDAESGKIEKLRQSCLYIETTASGSTLPSEVFGEDESIFYTILSGELMAEVLGICPQYFEYLLDLVIQHERSLGLDDELIKRG